MIGAILTLGLAFTPSLVLTGGLAAGEAQPETTVTTSVFLSTRNAAKAVLLASPALAGGFVLSGRAVPLPAEKTAGIFVRLARSTGEAPFAGATRADWDTDIVISMVARASDGEDAETAIDALLTAVYARLATAASDADGWTVQPSIAWDIDEADDTIGNAELRLRVHNRTGEGTLAADT